MGSYYAKAAGETDAVSQAIADHYRPRFSGDNPPATRVGKVVAVADKLDTICGLFAVDQAPTGSSDPFALRRSALGIVTMLCAGDDFEFDLVPAIDAALAAYAADGIEFDAQAVRQQVIEFFVTRTKVMERDNGVSADAIDAVLAAGVREPLEFAKRVVALEHARREDPDTFNDLAVAYGRANNLRDPELGVDYDESLLCEVEHALTCAIVQAEGRVARALEANDYPEPWPSLLLCASGRPVLRAHFMVMD